MDSRDVSESILEALNDIDDKYISHARSIRPRRMVSLRSVLIAAVVVALAVVSAMAVYSSKTYSYDRYQNPTNDPVTSVTNLLEQRSKLSYVMSIEIYGATVDEEETARVLSEETELASEQCWDSDNFAVVYAEYYEIYYMVFDDDTDGYQANWFWMEYDEVNDIWVLYGSSDIDSSYHPEYLGLFNEEGVGHQGWCKDDVGSYDAAIEYLEEYSEEDYFIKFELLGCASDADKIEIASSENYPRSYEQSWFNISFIRIYNFNVYYVEFYAEYDHDLCDLEDGYHAVWLLMEKDSETEEWSCYKMNTGEIFEYQFITYTEISKSSVQPDDDIVSVAISWLIDSNLEEGNQTIVYGAKVDYTKTRQVLTSNKSTAYTRGWSREDKNFLVVYVEFNVSDTDKIYYIWLEKDSETGEWEYYFSVDSTKGWNEWEFK